MSYGTFTNIANGTRILNYSWDQCVALANLYSQGVVKVNGFVGVNYAYQWWTDFYQWGVLTSNYVRSGTPVAGAIFVAKGGIYDAVAGHIGVVTKVYPNGTFDTIEQNGGRYYPQRYFYRWNRGMQNILGFLIPNKNPAGAVVTTTQRVAGSGGSKRREKPTSKSKDLGSPLKPGTVGNFKGWVNGENVGGNNLWYVGTSGAYFWSGGFTSVTKSGLKDLNVMTPTQRKTKGEPVIRRAAATTKSKNLNNNLPANAVINFGGWMYGESIGGNNLWYVGKSTNCFWSGAFTTVTKVGLKDVNPITKPDERKVGQIESLRRASASTKAKIVGDPLRPGQVVVFKGWVNGERVNGNSLWYVGYSGNCFWSGAFTTVTKAGLKDLN